MQNKQTHRHRKQTMVTKGRGKEKQIRSMGLIQTSKHQTDKQQGFTV